MPAPGQQSFLKVGLLQLRHEVLEMVVDLPVQDDAPDQAEDQLWVAIHNVVAADVHQLHIVLLQNGQGVTHVVEVVDSHLAPLPFLYKKWCSLSFMVQLNMKYKIAHKHRIISTNQKEVKSESYHKPILIALNITVWS